MMGKYQPFHDLPASQYEALKADIAERGVLIPIVVDENDTTIDGHQRRRAAAEAGVECPRQVVDGLNDDEKQGLAIALNAFRRHLSGVERSQAIKKLRALGLSTRQIADQIGKHQSTVVRALNQGDASASPDDSESPETTESDDSGGATRNEIPPQPKKVTGKDGKSYPAQRAPRKKKPSTTKAVALALYKLAEAAEAFEAIDAKKLPDYASEVPVWAGNLTESMKTIESFKDKLMEVST